MGNPVKSISRAAFAAALLLTLNPAFATVYTIAPGSSLTLSGDLTVRVGSFSVSSVLLEQAPGSLTTPMIGSLVAVADASQLSFPGGSAIAAADLVPRLPSGVPAAFGFKADFAYAPGVSVQLVSAIRELKFDLTGSAPLTGPSGNRSFDVGGLQLLTLTGKWDAEFTLCTPQCDQSFDFTVDVGGGPADPLAPGTGNLTTSAGTQTVSFPLSVTSTASESQDVEGVTVTVSGTLTLQGPAIAVIPEPSGWMLVLTGLLLLSLTRLRSIAGFLR
jgi:hypothetical protein